MFKSKTEELAVKNKTMKNFTFDKYCDNKSEYFGYHTEVASAFTKDCEQLLKVVAARQSFYFKTFAEIWKELSFSLVFVGQEFIEELSLFADSSFFTIKKYIIFSENPYIQVGAFYLLFGIYTKQLSTDQKVRIPITLAEYKHILNLVNRMEALKIIDFGYLFRILKYNQVFRFVAKPRCYGLESKFTWQEKSLKNDIFQDLQYDTSVTTIENVLKDDFNGLESLRERYKVLQEGLEEFAASSGTNLDVIQLDMNFFDNCEEFSSKLGINLHVNSVEDDDEIDLKQRAALLKKKAYTSPPKRDRKVTKKK